MFVAQAKDHDATDWDEVAGFVRANGVELVVIGPTPQWVPSLPIVVARNLKAPRDVVGDGLAPQIFATDDLLRQSSGKRDFRYVSLIEALCKPGGCVASVDAPDQHNLLVVDYGHLSPAGSVYVARTILRDLLRAPDRR